MLVSSLKTITQTHEKLEVEGETDEYVREALCYLLDNKTRLTCEMHESVKDFTRKTSK